MSLVEIDVEGWVIKMSAVGKIKASRHAPQRNDTAIKLYIKVARVIYFAMAHTSICVRSRWRGFARDVCLPQKYTRENYKPKNFAQECGYFASTH